MLRTARGDANRSKSMEFRSEEGEWRIECKVIRVLNVLLQDSTASMEKCQGCIEMILTTVGCVEYLCIIRATAGASFTDTTNKIQSNVGHATAAHRFNGTTVIRPRQSTVIVRVNCSWRRRLNETDNLQNGPHRTFR
jgi:hypothetical protein